MLELKRSGWQQSSCGTVHLQGHLLFRQQLLNADQLATLLLPLSDNEALCAVLADCSGFFALVLQNEQSLWLISDHVRSFPLFCYQGPHGHAVSDDASVLSLLVGETVIPAENAREFTALGYVLAPDTLFANVLQVPAGCCYWFSAEQAQTLQYFSWQRRPVASNTEQQLLVSLDLALTAAVRQLLQLAGERQLVVPLSGGYDSRAILMYLHKLGCRQLVTFTFGAAGSAELAQAKLLAQQLQVEWHPVVYDAALWQSLRDDAEFQRYCQFVSNGVSVPNVQVWPAVRQLVASGVIKPGALVVPGHTGDFISGGHLSGNTQSIHSQNDFEPVVRYLLAKHYRLDKDQLPITVVQRLRQSCLQLWQHGQNWTVEDLAEAWNWQYRQSQFIVNSNRYYEFFGLHCWLPLWERQFIDLWLQVPKQYLRQQRLWRALISNQSELLGITVPTQNAAKQPERFNTVKLALNYFFDRNLLVRLVPFHHWLLYRLGLCKHSGTLYSFLARQTLKQLKKISGQ